MSEAEKKMQQESKIDQAIAVITKEKAEGNVALALPSTHVEAYLGDVIAS